MKREASEREVFSDHCSSLGKSTRRRRKGGKTQLMNREMVFPNEK